MRAHVSFASTMIFCATLLGCANDRTKLAERTGCAKDDLSYREDSSSPVHKSWIVECSGKSYRCIDLPVFEACEELKVENKK